MKNTLSAFFHVYGFYLATKATRMKTQEEVAGSECAHCVSASLTCQNMMFQRTEGRN